MATSKNSASSRAAATAAAAAVPVGGYVLAAAPIEFNTGRVSIVLKVRNTGDRPIQVGSHFHFFEVNRALSFDRASAFGMHLNIASSTAIRFEPGDEKEVALVPFAGKQRVCGFNNLVDGWTGSGPSPGYQPKKAEAVRRAAEFGFKSDK
jgi:urease subunit beta